MPKPWRFSYGEKSGGKPTFLTLELARLSRTFNLRACSEQLRQTSRGWPPPLLCWIISSSNEYTNLNSAKQESQRDHFLRSGHRRRGWSRAVSFAGRRQRSG